MPRNVKRFSSAYLEELQEQPQNKTYEYTDFDATSQVSEDFAQEVTEESKPQDSSSAKVWKKIGKITLIILIFVALFFASMHITTFVLNMNHQVDDYNSDAPAYSDNEDKEEFGIVIDTDENTESITVVEDETDEEQPAKKPSSSTSSSESSKPATSTSSNDKKDQTQTPANSGSNKTDTPASSGNVKENTQKPSGTKENTSDKPASGNIKPEKPVTAPKPSAPSANPAPSAPSASLVPSAPTLVPGA